jgi:hypothetical protein
MSSFPEPVQWNGPDMRPFYDERAETEDEREHRWARFYGECVEFAGAEPDGWAAVLRAVAVAMKGSRS